MTTLDLYSNERVWFLGKRKAGETLFLSLKCAKLGDKITNGDEVLTFNADLLNRVAESHRKTIRMNASEASFAERHQFGLVPPGDKRKNLEDTALVGDWSKFSLTGAVLKHTTLHGNFFRARFDRIHTDNVWVTLESNLHGASFAGARIRWAGFKRVNLPLTIFAGARITGSWFSHADLTGANFTGATIQSSKLFSANLNSAYLEGGEFTGVDFRKSNLKHAKMKHGRFVDCDFGAANMENADLRGAVFERCKMPRADFSSADMEGATFYRCKLGGANFRDADFRGFLMETEVPPNFYDEIKPKHI